MSFNSICENKIIAKISEFTVPLTGFRPALDLSAFSNISCEITGPIELKFHMETPWVGEEAESLFKWSW